MARRRRKIKAEGFGALILTGCLFLSTGWLLHVAGNAWRSSQGQSIVIAVVTVVGLMVIGTMIRKIILAKNFRNQISKVDISDSRDAYIIENDDYRRGNAKENYYRKAFQLSLLEIFGNRCAKCGSNDNGVDLDHFFLSKNEGGSFIMRHREGHLVNNAIPLCQSCNRSKSDKSYRSFYSTPQILGIFQRNAIMTKMINDKKPFATDGRVNKLPMRRSAA